MAKTPREEITDGLFMLAAGADPDIFRTVVRTFVLQHVMTAEDATELLCDLASINPPALAASLQSLTAKPDSADARRVDPARAARFRKLLAHGAITVKSITAAQKPAPIAKKARATKRAKRAAKR